MPKLSRDTSSSTSIDSLQQSELGLGRVPLAPHQAENIEWIGRVNRGVLGDEPGLGKSRVAIEAFDGGRVLVIAPSMVIAGGTWADELGKWADHPENFVIAPYSMLNARKQVGERASTTSPIHALRSEFKGDWDAIIVDEAHYTKGRNTSWTWAVEQIARRSGAVLEMTGTPMPNWAHELFTVLRVVKDARRGQEELGSYNRWVDRWFIRTPNYWNKQALDIGGLKRCLPECDLRPPTDPCEHWVQFTQDNLGDQFIRHLRDDVLTGLPPLTQTEVKTPMDTNQKRMYRELRDEYLTNTPDGEEVVAWTPGSRNVMLDRITTSAWFLDKVGEPRGGKLDRLKFDLEYRSRPTIVWAHYQETVEACARVATLTGARSAAVHGGISPAKNAQALADFKAGKIDVLVGSLEKMSEGHTLNIADMSIFVEKSFKPSRNEQAMRRNHRMGQERPVTVLDYITPDSVDERKRVLLAAKTDQQIRVLTAAEFAKLL